VPELADRDDREGRLDRAARGDRVHEPSAGRMRSLKVADHVSEDELISCGGIGTLRASCVLGVPTKMRLATFTAFSSIRARRR
jgi:hypothetical protein